MDDEQYRQAREAISQPRCCYEKAIQHGYFGCQWHRRVALGERESLHCTRQVAYTDCDTFHSLTLKQSGFALGSPRMPVHLSFNQAMKVQIGGLRGVIVLAGKPVMEPGRTSMPELHDISDELAQLKERNNGSFESVDFSGIMPQISGFSARRRRK